MRTTCWPALASMLPSGWPDRPPPPSVCPLFVGFPSPRPRVSAGLPQAAEERLHRPRPAGAAPSRALPVLALPRLCGRYTPVSFPAAVGSRTVCAFAPGCFHPFVATTRAADFSAAFGRPRGPRSRHGCAGSAEISPDKPHPLPRTVADSTLPGLDQSGFRGLLPALPPFAPP